MAGRTGVPNGDVGLVVAGAGASDRTRATFLAPDGALRSARETVFAMSIHESQGSEFEEVLVVLPEKPSPLSSRELSYTALTRARRNALVFASPEGLRACGGRTVTRASGLRDALWGAERR